MKKMTETKEAVEPSMVIQTADTKHIDPAFIEKIAELTFHSADEISNRVKGWIAGAVLPEPRSGIERRLVITIAATLIRLGQVGVSGARIKDSAALLRQRLSASTLPQSELWLAISSQAPELYSHRMRMIDAVAKARNDAIVLVDVAGLFKASA